MLNESESDGIILETRKLVVDNNNNNNNKKETQRRKCGPPRNWMPPPPPYRNSGGVVTLTTTTTTFHPDFVFCVDCTNCQIQETTTTTTATTTNDDWEAMPENVHDKQNLDDTTNNSSSTSSSWMIQTRLILVNETKTTTFHNYSREQKLILESLLLPIGGVRKVMVQFTSGQNNDDDDDDDDDDRITILVHHDASCGVQDFLTVLQHAGYTAAVADDSLSIDHDTQSLTTPIINNNDNNDISIATTTLHDDEEQQHDSQSTMPLVKSVFFVQGICCASEVPMIRKILRPLPGVVSLQMNITTKRVYVQHQPHSCSAEQIAQILEQEGFPANIVRNGNHHHNHQESTLSWLAQPKSSLVESTLFVSNLTTRHAPILNKAITQNFECTQVRAIHPHVNSKTVKVEHNPLLVTCSDICETLSKYGLDASVITDGQQENLILPLEMESLDDNDGKEPKKSALGGEEWQSTQLSLHVFASGIFWLLALISVIRQWHTWELASGLISVVLGLPPIAWKACRTLRRCQLDANCMMVTAAVGALALAEWNEAASVAFLFSISEYLEARATTKARTALAAICQLRPDFAQVIHPETRDVVIVPAERVPVGSLIAVRTGDKIAADGVVVEGTSLIDESSLTGESVPVQKTIDDLVSGGGINVGSTRLVIRTTTSVDNSAVSRLIRLVEEAQANTSPTEKMIDGFARSYTPFVLYLALLMCTVPWIWGPKMGRHWTLNGLIIIVISCPCALTISTPVTYAAGLAATAQRGIVVKGGASLESLGAVKTVLLDKTGTLTEGKFKIVHLQEIGINRKEMLELLAVMEAPSSHPLSASLVERAKSEGVSSSCKQVKEHTTLKGEGVTAWVDGQQVFVGNVRLFERVGMYESLPQVYRDRVGDWTKTGGSVGFIGVQGKGIIGVFCVMDIVRPESREVVETLLMDGIDVHMLTGDGEGAAHSVALQVGLPSDCVHAKLLPEDKLHYVGSMKIPMNRNHKRGLFRRAPRILFCGDGVNDAPALAVADVGVSMGEGAFLAMEMSDVTLMDSNLHKLVYALKMGSRVVCTIQENILISFACKVVVVVLTFLGYMSLLFAIASDVGVMLLVTLNGMKLLPGEDDDSNGNSCCCCCWRILNRQHNYRGLSVRSSNATTTAIVEEDDNFSQSATLVLT